MLSAFEVIKQLLVDRFAIDPSRIDLATDLENELQLDSLDAVDLLMALNETFRVRISETALASAKTVSDLVLLVEQEKKTIKKQ